MNQNKGASFSYLLDLNNGSSGIKITASFVLTLILFLTISGASFPSHAQVSGTGTTNQSYLTEDSRDRNTTGSCDSTCDAMGAVAPPTSIVSSLQTRIQACAAGYTGQRTQTRTQNADGTFSPWVDASTSQCTCSPTHQDTTQTCTSPLSGTFVQRTNWTCSANVGSWGTPFTQTSNCFTPCAVPATQYTSGACPAGYVGAYYYQNPGVCPGGAGSNSTPYYSGWTMYSNQCALPRFSYGQFLSIWYTGIAGECDYSCAPGYGIVYNYTGYNITIPASNTWPYYNVNAVNWAPGEILYLPFEIWQWQQPFYLGNGQYLLWNNGPTYPSVIN